MTHRIRITKTIEVQMDIQLEGDFDKNKSPEKAFEVANEFNLSIDNTSKVIDQRWELMFPIIPKEVKRGARHLYLMT